MASIATLTSSGADGSLLNGKTLTLSKGSTKVDVPNLEPDDFVVSVKGSGTVRAETGKQADPSKITVIDASKTTSSVNITAGDKATTITLGTGGGVVTGSTKADKFYGGKGADTFYTSLNGGNDQIGDGKNSSTGFGKNDKLVIEGVDSTLATFTDNSATKSVITINGKQKITVNKADSKTPISVQFADKTVTYGADGTNTTYDASKKTVTFAKGSGTLDADTVSGSAKIIDATKVNGVWVDGNGQANNISVSGSGNNTVSGGVGYTIKNGTSTAKATNDNLYGAKTRANANSHTTFYIGPNSGNDNIYNYSAGDTIYIADGTGSIDFTDKKAFKDAGNGKDVTIFVGEGKKNKVVVKANSTNEIIIHTADGTQTYGLALPDNTTLDAKRTAVSLKSAATGVEVNLNTLMNTLNGGTTFAPKLNTIDATAGKGNNTLRGYSDKANVLKGSNVSGAHTTMIGGSANDNFYGGTGTDIFYINASTLSAIGKDVINDYGNGDVIVLGGISSLDAKNVAIDAKGAITLFDTSDSDAAKSAKSNSITIKNFKKFQGTVLVTDANGKILATTTNQSTTAPLGLTYSSSKITTTKDFTGKYDSKSYVVGDTIDLTNPAKPTGGSDPVNGAATIDAADYGGNVKTIAPTVVSDNVTSLYVKGNAANNNAIYAAAHSKNDLSVTLEGGAKNDTFYGNASTLTTVTYMVDPGGKDVINDYKKGDIVKLGVASVSTDMIGEKGTDVIVTLEGDKSKTLTIKNAAGTEITFENSVTGGKAQKLTYGYILPDGLEYNSKHTDIHATSAINNSKYVTNEGTTSSPKYIASTDVLKLDLSNNDYSTVSGQPKGVYAGIKTVSLAGSVVNASIVGSSIANELYAGTGGSTLYGGYSDKAAADKLYGNTGVDYFVYKSGDGADVIGSKTAANSSLEAQDFIVIGSAEETAVASRDDLTFTDKKNVVTIQFDNKNKLTVNKKDTATPIKLYYTNSTLGGANNKATLGNYDVYGVDTRKFQANTSQLENGSIVITGAGIRDTNTTSGTTFVNAALGKASVYTYDDENGDFSNQLIATYTDPNNGSSTKVAFADVNINNVSSQIKNVSVSDANLRVNIVGNANSNNISVGAGGGTISGGYNTSTNKATNDNLYGSAIATARGTTFVVDADQNAGKDNIYNYDAARGDVLHFSEDPTNIKVSAKNIVFSFGNNTTATVSLRNNANITTDTNIAIAIGSLEAETYYGWTSGKTTLSDYEDTKRDTQWTKSGNNFIFTGINKNRSSLYGAAYTVTGSLIDADGDFKPDAITKVDTASGKEGQLVFNKDVYVDPDINQFHIVGNSIPAGNDPEKLNDADMLKEGDTLTINNLPYVLADIDKNTVTNDLELSYNGWVKSGPNSVVYYGLSADNKKLADDPRFTITGTFDDESIAAAEATVGLKVKGYLDAFTFSDTKASGAVTGHNVVINIDSDTIITDTRLILSSDENDSYSKYRVWGGTNTSRHMTYKLYDRDGDSVNGYELLRTDLADKAGWTLVTGENETSPGRVQSKGTGVWEYESVVSSANNTNFKFKFSIDSDAGVKAIDETGLPVGVEVIKHSNTQSGSTIVFTNAVDSKYVHFDAGTTFGSEAGAVHIEGYEVGTRFTVAGDNGDSVYITAELDGKDNGLELVKSNSEWSFDNGAWYYDNRNIAGTKLEDQNDTTSARISAWDSDAAKPVVFSIDASAGIPDDGTGRPKGVTVTAEAGSATASGANASDKVKSIDFSGIFNSANKTAFNRTTTDTSFIHFTSLPTGDIDSSVSIIGFNSSTSVSLSSGKTNVPTYFTVGDKQYYLVDLHNNVSPASGAVDSTTPYELLAVNDKWIRTADGWKYFNSGSPSFNGYADISIGASSSNASDGTVRAALDGSPRGISVSEDGNTVIINDSIGVIDRGTLTSDDTYDPDGATDNNGKEMVTLNAAQLHFGTTTTVNDFDGMHIIGFNSDTTLAVDRVDSKGKLVPAASIPGGYLLADLDRNPNNGLELIHNDTLKGWTFNSGKYGKDSDGNDTLHTESDVHLIGSWTYNDTNVKIANKALTFDISADASVLGENDTLGIPKGIEVVTITGEAGATIKANNSDINSSHFIFGGKNTQDYRESDTAIAYFSSSAGLHFVGSSFNEGDVITVATSIPGTSEAPEATLSNVSFRLAQLDGNTVNGYELLRFDPANDVWTLTAKGNGDSGKTAATRAWDYYDSRTGVTMSIGTGASLKAAAPNAPAFSVGSGSLTTLIPVAGGPEGVTIQGYNETNTDGNITMHSIFHFDSDTSSRASDGKKVLASDLSFMTNYVGSDNSIHIIGFDSGTTLKVNDETYQLINLDGVNSNGNELVKYNSDWTFYQAATTQPIKGVNTAIAAGNWVYDHTVTSGSGSKATTAAYSLVLGNTIGVRSIAEGNGTITTGVAPADSTGAPVGITVSYSGLIPTFEFDVNSLNIAGAGTNGQKRGVDEAPTKGSDTSLITLDANLAYIGKKGLHILGFDSDTTLNINDGSNPRTYYLANLDGDADNGLELVYKNANWRRTRSDGWSFESDSGTHKLHFKITSDLAPVESDATINESLVGSASGITLSKATGADYFNTINVGVKDSKTKVAVISAEELQLQNGYFTAGSDTKTALHIDGLKLNDEIVVTIPAASENDSPTLIPYQLKELDGDASDGMELWRVNQDGWNLTNVSIASGGKDSLVGREWSFSGGSGNAELVFKVTADDPKKGLRAGDSDTGLPIGASVTTISGSDADSFEWKITFGDTDTSNGTKNSIELSRVQFSAVPTGANGVHILGLKDSDTTNGTKIAYASDTSNMFTIGGSQYYLAELDGNTSNGMELVKYDKEWHRTAEGWTYNKKDVLKFSFNSGTAKWNFAESDGRPVGIEVSADGKTISITTDASIGSALTFDSGGSIANANGLHITVVGDNNVNSATTEYKFSGTVGSDSNVDVKYYVVDADNSIGNGYEFVKPNAHWTRYNTGWLYQDESDTNKTTGFSFFVDSTAPKLDAATGAPMGSHISVDADHQKITFGSSANINANNIILFNDASIRAGIDLAEKNSGTHIVGSGVKEGDSVRFFNGTSDQYLAVATVENADADAINKSISSYQLYQADGNTGNGLELTNNGWFDTSVKIANVDSDVAYRYATKDVDVTFIGKQFGATGASLRSSDVEEGFNIMESTAARHGITVTKDGITIDGGTYKSYTSDAFKVIIGNGLGSDRAKSVVVTNAGGVEDQTYTFSLKNVDDNATTYELTNNGWYKQDTQTFHYSNTGVAFTLKSNNNSLNLDSISGVNNNLIPDMFETNYGNWNYKDSKMSITLAAGTATDSVSLKFIFNSKEDSVGFKDIYVADANGSLTAYTLDGSDKEFTLKASPTTTPSQLPASGWATTGYDIDDILGDVIGDGTSATGELDDILEIKALGDTASASTFDPDSAFTEVGTTNKDITALGLSARKKARK